MRCAVLLVVLLGLSPVSAQTSDPLRRRADWGIAFRADPTSKAVKLVRLRASSPAASAGLREGDVLVQLDGKPLPAGDAFAERMRRYRAGDPATWTVRRGSETLTARLTAAPRQKESIAGLVVDYGSVQTDRGFRVRTVTTRPEGVTGRLPVVVFIPWLSCDSVEAPEGPTDGWGKMLRSVALRSGMVLVRIERPGVGDSEGPACAEADLETDMAAFRAVLRQVRERADVDPARVYLFGGSIGAALAPILATEFPVAGLVATGAFTRTWNEHILANERRALVLRGTSPAEVNAAMHGFAAFYALYLQDRLTPRQVLQRRPDLKPLWHDAPEHQYGRPARYFHEVQALNVEAAWDRVRVPVLLVWGEYDWIMGREEQERIGQILRARDPQLLTYVPVPGMNHHFEIFPDAVSAFKEEGGHYEDGPAERISSWLRDRATR